MVTPAAYFKDQSCCVDYHDDYDNAEIIDYLKSRIATVENVQSFSNLQDTEQAAINNAKTHTARNKILVIIDSNLMTPPMRDSNNELMEYIVADDATQLCLAIACSTVRIAAIVVRTHKASNYFYKKVRELSSAEGAVMIWNILNNEPIKIGLSLNMSKKSLPDLICFKTQSHFEQYWLGGKSELMSLSV